MVAFIILTRDMDILVCQNGLRINIYYKIAPLITSQNFGEKQGGGTHKLPNFTKKQHGRGIPPFDTRKRLDKGITVSKKEGRKRFYHYQKGELNILYTDGMGGESPTPTIVSYRSILFLFFGIFHIEFFLVPGDFLPIHKQDFSVSDRLQ